MSILGEEELNQIAQRFTELDFKDTNFVEKVEEIVNDVLKDNVDKIGTVSKVTTIDEALSEEKEGFKELQKLQEDRILEHIENKDLKNKLEENARDGIKDEEAEKLSLKEAGYVVEEAFKEAKSEDILAEIFKNLEEVIEEKKKAIDKKIEENEAMRSKVEKREQLKIARARVNILYQKTRNYKGTEGKNLNQNVEAAVTDLDNQLAKLTKETSRDGVEMADAMLDEENKKFEEKKKGLDDLLNKIKESYKNKDNKDIKLDLIEKQIDDIIAEITGGMKFEDFQSKAKELYKIYQQNEKLFRNKMITIKKEDDRGIEKEVQFDVERIAYMGSGEMNTMRARYINYTSAKPKTDEEKEMREEFIEMVEIEYESHKEVLETICGNEVYVEPLMTEQDYVNKISKMAQYAEKRGMMGSGKANKAAQEMQKLYRDLERFFEYVEPDSRETIATKYEIVAEALYDNPSVKKENLPPRISIPKKRKRIDVEQVETPVVRQKENGNVGGLEQVANEVKNEQGETSQYGYLHADSDDGSRV